MKNLQEQKCESFDYIHSDYGSSDICFNEQEGFESYLHHLINLKIPPFIVSLNYHQQEDEISHPHQNIPQISSMSQKIMSYNRKEKSLSQLTKKFIQKFQGNQSRELVIDKVTVQMNVQRRRIYDIINIMESLNVVKKIKKNIYEWRGLIQALKTIESYNQQEQSQQMVIDRRSRKERSLQSLATQFLKLFSKNKYNSEKKRRLLSLQQASGVIMNVHEKDSKKTKVRRLYDIVNVFKCMGLVRKIKVEGCKPGYQWMGTSQLVKIIQAKANNKSLWLQQEYGSDNEIGKGCESQKHAQGQRIQLLIQRQNFSENKTKRIQSKTIRSISNSIQFEKQSSNQFLEFLKIKKSQSCSATFKNNVVQPKEKRQLKYRQNRFSAFKQFREKNSCSPLTNSTTLSTLTGSRSLKKKNIFPDKNRKQFLDFDDNISEVKEQKKQVDEEKPNQVSFKQFEYSSESKRKSKIPKKLSKNISDQASHSMLSSLIAGYKLFGITSLDQFIEKMTYNLFSQNNNNQKARSLQLIQKMNEKGQMKLIKLNPREFKSLQKQTKLDERKMEQGSFISAFNIKDGQMKNEFDLIL